MKRKKIILVAFSLLALATPILFAGEDLTLIPAKGTKEFMNTFEKEGKQEVILKKKEYVNSFPTKMGGGGMVKSMKDWFFWKPSS
jgi:hypothetical protein